MKLRISVGIIIVILVVSIAVIISNEENRKDVFNLIEESNHDFTGDR